MVINKIHSNSKKRITYLGFLLIILISSIFPILSNPFIYTVMYNSVVLCQFSLRYKSFITVRAYEVAYSHLNPPFLIFLLIFHKFWYCLIWSVITIISSIFSPSKILKYPVGDFICFLHVYPVNPVLIKHFR